MCSRVACNTDAEGRHFIIALASVVHYRACILLAGQMRSMLLPGEVGAGTQPKRKTKVSPAGHKTETSVCTTPRDRLAIALPSSEDACPGHADVNWFCPR